MQSPPRRTRLDSRPAENTGPWAFSCPEPDNAAGSVPSWARDTNLGTGSLRRTSPTTAAKPELDTAAAGSLARLLTVKEVAEALTVSPKTVRRMIDSGQLRAIRVRRALRVRRVDYDCFLDDL
jgi:excisionase family DNA binding protein